MVESVSVGTNTTDSLVDMLQELKTLALLCIQNTITVARNVKIVNVNTINKALQLCDDTKNTNVSSLLRSVRNAIVGTNVLATDKLIQLSKSMAKHINYSDFEMENEAENETSATEETASSTQKIELFDEETQDADETRLEHKEKDQDPLERLAATYRLCDICYYRKQETEFAYHSLCSHVICKHCIRMFHGNECMICRTPIGAYTHIEKTGSRFGITLWFPIVTEEEYDGTTNV